MTGFQSDDPRWQRHLVLGDADWRILVRPLRPDDDPRIRDLLEHVSQPDLRLRFFNSIKEFSPEFIARLTHLDYARAMAFVAIDEGSDETLGVVRLHIDSSREAGEYAILLRSDLKGRGLGWALMQLIIEYAKFQGLKRVYGQILQRKFRHAENVPGVGIQGRGQRRGSRRVRCHAHGRTGYEIGVQVGRTRLCRAPAKCICVMQQRMRHSADCNFHGPPESLILVPKTGS